MPRARATTTNVNCVMRRTQSRLRFPNGGLPHGEYTRRGRALTQAIAEDRILVLNRRDFARRLLLRQRERDDLVVGDVRPCQAAARGYDRHELPSVGAHV